MEQYLFSEDFNLQKKGLRIRTLPINKWVLCGWFFAGALVWAIVLFLLKVFIYPQSGSIILMIYGYLMSLWFLVSLIVSVIIPSRSQR
ncbi:MAG: hypothetical protein JWM92_336 [Candidatus Nomurabacteria bacterium]|jgi:hypothetical protein|nr:hypothetical protein [Candidatus Nomurabacteria bacterium]